MPKAPKTKQKQVPASAAVEQSEPLAKKGKYVEGQADLLSMARLAAQEEGTKRNAKLQKQQSRTRKVS